MDKCDNCGGEVGDDYSDDPCVCCYKFQNQFPTTPKTTLEELIRLERGLPASFIVAGGQRGGGIITKLRSLLRRFLHV